MNETIEHNNRFYGEELKTESEQLKEWLIVANKEIERLKEELKYTVPVVEHNKTITKHLNEIERLNNIINELEEYHTRSIKNLEKMEEFNFIGVNHIKILHSEHTRILDKIKELKGSDKA